MKSNTALLILDMLNTFDFPEGKTLAKRAVPIAKNIAKLKRRCINNEIPVIYVNDNFGQWHANRDDILNKCIQENCLGKTIAEMIRPSEKDLFVLKRKHSGFYFTNLEPLLLDLNVKKLILTGIAGDICVLFTAHDAHMREFDLIIPKDCVTCNTDQSDRFLFHQLKNTLKFPVTISTNIRF